MGPFAAEDRTPSGVLTQNPVRKNASARFLWRPMQQGLLSRTQPFQLQINLVRYVSIPDSRSCSKSTAGYETTIAPGRVRHLWSQVALNSLKLALKFIFNRSWLQAFQGKVNKFRENPHFADVPLILCNPKNALCVLLWGA
jgi:hypothetical protein